MMRRPTRPTSPRTGAAVLAALVALAGLGVQAVAEAPRAVSVSQVSGSAEATATADRSTPPAIDVVSVGESNTVSAPVIESVEAAAQAVGARTALSRGFSVGLTAVRRGSTVVQAASGPSGLWQFPMSTTVLPATAAGEIMGGQVATALTAGHVVMGETSAALRGAAAGDVVDLVAQSGAILTFVVGYVATDAAVGGTEIVMSPEVADALGATRVTRILLFGQFSREAVDVELNARGIIDGTSVRVNRSWNPRNPDSTLGLARTKVLLGEFDYEVTDTGVRIDAAWRDANIVQVSYTGVGVRASCHQRIISDMQAAFSEIAGAGLAGAIDTGNTNTYGGCFNPRFNRITGSIGFLSRHTWAQAIDMNTVTNAQGRTPQMDCRVVRIFRKHGFAWGGNFLVPDGMHFEWVGEPRHELPYPSEYCPNLSDGRIQLAGIDGTERSVLFADDGWDAGHG